MGCVVAIIAFVFFAAIACVLGAVGIGTVCAWFLDTPFSVGWEAAWDQPLKLLLFIVFVAPFFFSRAN